LLLQTQTILKAQTTEKEIIRKQKPPTIHTNTAIKYIKELLILENVTRIIKLMEVIRKDKSTKFKSIAKRINRPNKSELKYYYFFPSG